MRLPRGAAVLAAAITLTLGIGGAPLVASGQTDATGGGAPAEAPAGPTPKLTFVTQTPWLPADTEFAVVVRVDLPPGGDPSAFEVDATLFPSVASRTAFAESLVGRGLRPPLAIPLRMPLAQFPRNPDGTLTLRLPPPAMRRNGIHPVRVELRDIVTNTTVERFMTHLTYLPEPNEGPRLAVSLVLPVHLPPSLAPDGSRRAIEADRLAAIAQAVQVAGTIPVSLAPTPETLTALVAAGGGDGGLLTVLRQVATQRRITAGPYVPVNLPTMLASGPRGEVDVQLQRGIDVLSEALRADPDQGTWTAREPLDATSVDLLAARGVQRVVANDADLTPTGDRLLTLTRPFLLAGAKASVPAVVADPSLNSYFDDFANPALAAIHLLSDLAVLHLDRPGDRRGAVAMPSRSWQPSRQFLDLVVAGLSTNPILEPVEVGAFFATVDSETVAGRDTLVRRPVVSPVPIDSDLSRSIQSARRRLTSLDLVLGAGNLVSSELAERLLVAQSVDLRSSRQREPYVAAVRRAVSGQLEGVEMPEDRSITLTARRGEIPVTFRNRTGHPVKLMVTLESDKLTFPRGDRAELELTRLNTTHRFPVVARTSGAFPIRITLQSPDGQLIAGEATLTVRSTAASGVGLGISVGAALFLALWWGRNLSKNAKVRRSGKAVETNQGDL